MKKTKTNQDETKTIKVSDDNWRALNQIKLDAGYKNLDEVISKLRGNHK